MSSGRDVAPSQAAASARAWTRIGFSPLEEGRRLVPAPRRLRAGGARRRGRPPPAAAAAQARSRPRRRRPRARGTAARRSGGATRARSSRRSGRRGRSSVGVSTTQATSRARLVRSQGELDQAGEREQQDDDERARVAGGRVAGDVPEVGEDLVRRFQLPAAARRRRRRSGSARTRLGAPERDREDEHGREGRDRLAEALPRGEDIQALRGEDERAVRVRGDREQHAPRPRGSRRAAALARALGGAPGRRASRGRGTGCTSARRCRGRAAPSSAAASAVAASAGPRPARRLPRIAIAGRLATAKNAESEAHGPQPAADVGDDPGEQEVERRAAALCRAPCETGRRATAGRRTAAESRPRAAASR